MRLGIFSYSLFSILFCTTKCREPIWEWVESKNLNKWYRPWEMCLLASESDTELLQNVKRTCMRKFGAPSEKHHHLICRYVT